MNLNLKNPLVFFDLETTGTNITTDRIIELAYVKVFPNGKTEEKDIYIPIKHVSNSASIIDLAGFRKDMVRSGIITYGLYPSEEVSKDVLDLKPAMELKTHIVYIKEVGPGWICRWISKSTFIQGKSFDPWAVCSDHRKNLYGSVYG